MITNALINAGFSLISGFISLLPTSTGFDPSVLAAAHTIGGYFGMFAPIAPIGTLGIAIAVCFTVEIAIFGWKTFKSLISHVPQVGGAGH